MNPEISQRDAGGATPAVDARPPAPEDAALAIGFERLVQRVVRLEQLCERIRNAEPYSTDTVQPAAGSREENPVSPALMSPQSVPASPVSDAGTQTPDISSPSGAGAAPAETAILQAWRSASLTLRLKFVRELLPAAHALQPLLKEASSLEELRCNGRELETWLTGYPSLFADAADRLERRPDCGASAAETLAMETVNEARQVFAAEMETLGIEWIRPDTGAVIGEEHEVVGEEEASVPTGRVAGTRRRGFRQRGTLLLPARVTRAVTGGEAKETREWGQPGENRPANRVPGEREEASPTADSRQPAVDNRQPAAYHQTSDPRHQTQAAMNIDPWPDWLRLFQQRSMGCETPIVKQLLAVLRELTQTAAQYAGGARSEADLLARLEPLLPLLGARHVPSLLSLSGQWGDVVSEARDGLLAWLSSALDIVPIAPDAGVPCDAVTMQVTGIRRTAHAHEDGRVAKVERIGLRRGERVLFRAQVLRYEMGASYE